MANYSYVIDSRFDPFTYEEYLKNAQVAQNAHDIQQEKYDKLVADSSKWGAQLDPNSKAYATWKDYQDKLNSAASQLLSQGLTPTTRGQVSDLTKGYWSEIQPIAEADTAMQKDMELRTKIQMSDPSVKFKNIPSIDDYMYGKKGSNEYLSGKTLEDETAAMAEKLGRAIYSNPQFEKVMNDSYWQIKMANGANPNMMDYIMDGAYENIPHNESAKQADKDLYENMKAFARIYETQKARLDGYNDAEELHSGIVRGLYSGLAKPTYDYQANKEYMSKAERLSYGLQQQSLGLNAANSGMSWDADNGTWAYDPEKDPDITSIKKKAEATAAAKAATNGGSGSGTNRVNRLNKPLGIVVGSKKATQYKDEASIPKNARVVNYNELTDEQRKIVDDNVMEDSPNGYTIMVRDTNRGWSGGPDNDKNDEVILIPKKSTVVDNEGNEGDDDF